MILQSAGHDEVGTRKVVWNLIPNFWHFSFRSQACQSILVKLKGLQSNRSIITWKNSNFAFKFTTFLSCAKKKCRRMNMDQNGNELFVVRHLSVYLSLSAQMKSLLRSQLEVEVVNLFSSKSYWGKALATYTKPQEWKKENERLRGLSDGTISLVKQETCYQIW